MKETKKLSTSSWLTLAAAVLGIIGLVAYSTSEVAVKQIGIIAAIAIVLNMKYSFGILNLSSTVSAILFSVAFVYGFASQLDPLGWAVSGLYTWGQVAGFLVFAVLTFAALILEFVVSFKGLVK